MAAKTFLKITLTISLLLIVLVFSTTAHAKIIYVDDDAHADFDNIQAAIDAAVDGDIIVVGPGTYTGDGNRDIDYNGKAITVRSIDPNDPNIVAATIIDCNGTEEEPHRGFYFHNSEEANSIIAGLTITNGYASAGGAIRCEDSRPKITNCTFTGNTALDGAGIHCGFPLGGGAESSREIPFDFNIPGTEVTNCTFTGNLGHGMRIDGSGAVLRNCIFTENSDMGLAMVGGNLAVVDCTFTANQRGGMLITTCNATLVGSVFKDNTGTGAFILEGNVTFIDCEFTDNRAYWQAGGLYNGDSNTTLKNCIFTGNFGDRRAGGIHNELKGNLTMVDCTISGNSADVGAGLYNDNKSSAKLTNCIFSDNSANQGAGIYTKWGSLELVDCKLNNNSADPLDGGGIYCQDCALVITNCAFTANSAVNYGGGMYNTDANPTLTNCTFNDNSSLIGAGFYNSDSRPTITNCKFSGNSAQDYGGGMANAFSSPILANCTFNGNLANLSGGGMANLYGSPTLTNCTFTGNSALEIYSSSPSGGIAQMGGSLAITNCVLWENRLVNSTEESAQINGESIIIDYSCIQGWTGTFGGTGNIDADPFFVSPGYWDTNELWVEGDYHLLPGSPCIDAGDPNYIEEPNETDLDGRPRVMG